MASEKSWSSIPMTERSSGTFTPARVASKMIPMAISSEAQKIAVGFGPGLSQSRWKASWPLRTVKSPHSSHSSRTFRPAPAMTSWKALILTRGTSKLRSVSSSPCSSAISVWPRSIRCRTAVAAAA